MVVVRIFRDDQHMADAGLNRVAHKVGPRARKEGVIVGHTTEAFPVIVVVVTFFY